MQIRKAEARDGGAIASIILPTIRQGATYALDPDMSEADALVMYQALPRRWRLTVMSCPQFVPGQSAPFTGDRFCGSVRCPVDDR
jgi:hypothetical protein